MEIFISWSGERAKKIAEILHEWIPSVIQAVQPWVSQHNIDKGARWAQELPAKLGAVNFGIVCLTPESQNAPWLNFEAGALSKFVTESRVCTYLYQLERHQVEWPLAQFQNTRADDKEDTLKLMHCINSATKSPINPERLKGIFERFWPDLENQLKSIPTSGTAAVPKRSQEAILNELLELNRGIAKQIGAIASSKREPPKITTRHSNVLSMSSAEILAQFLNRLKEDEPIVIQEASVPEPENVRTSPILIQAKSADRDSADKSSESSQ